MASMSPGQTVLWQVGVQTRGDEEGAVHIGLGLTAGAINADALNVDVDGLHRAVAGRRLPGGR